VGRQVLFQGRVGGGVGVLGDGGDRIVADAVAILNQGGEEGDALHGLHVGEPMHGHAAGVDFAIRGQGADAVHLVVLHAEQNDSVVRRFQVDDAGLGEAVSDVV